MEEEKYKEKCKELSEKIKQVEKENTELQDKITKSKKNIKRLKIERSLVMDRLDKVNRPDIQIQPAIVYASDSETEKKEASKKDPNAPKRPANAFFFYCQLERSKLKEEHENASLSDLTKILGQKWKAMNADEKKKYYDMYELDKLRYEREMSNYQLKDDVDDPMNVDV